MLSVNLFGWPVNGIRVVTLGVAPRLATTTSRSRMLETYAVAAGPLPFTATQNGYSPPGTPDFAGSLLPGRRSSSVPWDQWPRPPVNTVIESL